MVAVLTATFFDMPANNAGMAPKKLHPKLEIENRQLEIKVFVIDSKF